MAVLREAGKASLPPPPWAQDEDRGIPRGHAGPARME